MQMCRVEAASHEAISLAKLPNYCEALSGELKKFTAFHSAVPAEAHYIADVGRFTLTQMALAIFFEHQRDYSRPRLTPKALHAEIEHTRVASRNTVQSFLRELVHVNLLEAPDQEKMRQHALRPTQKSLALMDFYFRLHLGMLDKIDNGSRSNLLNRNPELLSSLQPLFARRLCRTQFWYAPPEGVRCFTNSNSGSTILHTLMMLAKDREPDSEGRIWIGALSARQFAEDCQVSPAHVSRIFSTAQSLNMMGWVQPKRRDNCYISTILRQNYMLWQAEKLAALSIAFNKIRSSHFK